MPDCARDQFTPPGLTACLTSPRHERACQRLAAESLAWSGIHHPCRNQARSPATAHGVLGMPLPVAWYRQATRSIGGTSAVTSSQTMSFVDRTACYSSAGAFVPGMRESRYRPHRATCPMERIANVPFGPTARQWPVHVRLDQWIRADRVEHGGEEPTVQSWHASDLPRQPPRPRTREHPCESHRIARTMARPRRVGAKLSQRLTVVDVLCVGQAVDDECLDRVGRTVDEEG
jgi:hypothetical protein